MVSSVASPDMKKISVITIVFNAVRTIGKTLESVASQDYPNIEHVVVDGASTDGTLEVINQHDKRLLKFISEPDQGIYDAMNKGLALASGDIICFLNADDHYISPHVLSFVAAEMEKNDLDALMGDVVFFQPNKPEKILRRYNSCHFSPDKLAQGWMPAHTASFIKREIYQRIGQFKTNYRISGDFEFAVRMFTKTALNYRLYPEVLVKMQDGGISNSGMMAQFLLNSEIMRACRENGIKTSVWQMTKRYPAKLKELFKR